MVASDEEREDGEAEDGGVEGMSRQQGNGHGPSSLCL